jgi:hypothetical protein
VARSGRNTISPHAGDFIIAEFALTRHRIPCHDVIIQSRGAGFPACPTVIIAIITTED